MLIISKHIIALKQNPRIDEFPMEQVQERMRGQSPAYETNEDSGAPRKTHWNAWLSGFGPNRRGNGVGMQAPSGDGDENGQNEDQGLSSGYNRMPGEQGSAQEQDAREGGPGLSPTGVNPYYTVETNELFLDLDSKNNDRPGIENHLRQIQKSTPIETRGKHFRQSVDR